MNVRQLPNDPAVVQRIHKKVNERMRLRNQILAKRVKSHTQLGCRRLRLPDGTHMSYRIPTFSYMHWGNRLGFECWEDARFVHEYLRDNPECRVTNEAVNPTILVGWAPTKITKQYRAEKAKAAIQQQKAANDKLIIGGGG